MLIQLDKFFVGLDHREMQDLIERGNYQSTRIKCIVADEDVEAVVERIRKVAYSDDLGEEGIAVIPCEWQVLKLAKLEFPYPLIPLIKIL